MLILDSIIEHAMRIAEKSNSQYKHGAVLFWEGIILAGEPNEKVLWPRREPELHAEAKVLRHVFDRACLLVIRVTKTGLLAESKPCLDCMERIRESRIQTIFYSTRERVVRRLEQQ